MTLARTERIGLGILSFGLSELIPRVRNTRWAKYVIALLVLNELRGAYFAYLAYGLLF